MDVTHRYNKVETAKKERLNGLNHAKQFHYINSYIIKSVLLRKKYGLQVQSIETLILLSTYYPEPKSISFIASRLNSTYQATHERFERLLSFGLIERINNKFIASQAVIEDIKEVIS